MMMSGVFERFPKLKFVLSEQGCAWLRRHAAHARRLPHADGRSAASASSSSTPTTGCRVPPSEYFARNCWVGVSFPGVNEAKGMRKLGLENMMWGSDYPHHEGSTPFSRELLRMGFSDWSAADLDQVLDRTAAEVYGFDLDGSHPSRPQVGPTVDELRVPLDDPPEGATSPGFYR